MDKILAQSVILLVMLSLASASTLIYLSYVEPNTPQAAAEDQVYAQDATSLFYSTILQLYTDSGNKSVFWFIPPQNTVEGWVCRNIEDYDGASAAPCKDMVAKNTSVTRSFTTSFWDYYAVMVYLPIGTPQLNLTFNWWLKTQDPIGWVWFGAYIIKGDATGIGRIPFDAVESAPFYYSYEFFGGARSGVYNGLTVQGGYTLAILFNIIPSQPAQISYGFKVNVDNQHTITVVLPSTNYGATLTLGGQNMGEQMGPIAVFHVKSTQISGQLTVLYQGVPVAQTHSVFQVGEQIVFYAVATSQQPPQTLLMLNAPIKVIASNSSLTVKYGPANYTINLNAELLGGGVSNSWIIALIGCQEKCLITVSPG
ncbi:MAG: hypothetical protein QXH56_05305 [Thermoprotei archaeon]